MIEWKTLTSDEITTVDRRLPVIVPLGLVEAHGPHLPLSVDMDTADYFSRQVAMQTGAILAPQVYFGYADEMSEYPGTVGVTFETLACVVTDLSLAFCRQGFIRQIFLSGHGANRMPVELAFTRVWETFPNLRAVYWNYWTAAGVEGIHHADKGETEIAMSVGTKSYPERAREFRLVKPWYRIRSRHAIDPESGGINGDPTQAGEDTGRGMRDRITAVLVEKVRDIIQSEAGS